MFKVSINKFDRINLILITTISIALILYASFFLFKDKYTTYRMKDIISKRIKSESSIYGASNKIIFNDRDTLLEIYSSNLMPLIYFIDNKYLTLKGKIYLLNKDRNLKISVYDTTYQYFRVIRPLYFLQPSRYVLCSNGNIPAQSNKYVDVVMSQPLWLNKESLSSFLWEIKNAEVQQESCSVVYSVSQKAKFAQIRTRGYLFSKHVRVNIKFEFLNAESAIQIIFGELHGVFVENKNNYYSVGVVQALNKNGKRIDRRYKKEINAKSLNNICNITIIRENNKYTITNNDTREIIFCEDIGPTNIQKERFYSLGYLIWKPSRVRVYEFNVFDY